MTLGRRRFLAASVLSCLAACRRDTGPDARDTIAWGRPGLRDGHFQKPRAIGVHEDEVYVIDTSGRIQVFSVDGVFRRKWSTPAYKNGTPTAVAFAKDGNVLIPDTHYSQILKYTPGGRLLGQWGSYGAGPDQFIYPTDIVEDADGTYYVSEYGMDAERVHVFDARKRFVQQWGAFGEAEGEFNRAMAIAMDEDGRLYVADTANHRVQCFDRQGRLLRVVGEMGTAPGQMKFPYDVALAPDGSMLVCEYGSHRISCFSKTGGFVACFGGPGRGLGEFSGPRGVAVSPSGFVFAADTGNNRVQRFRLEELA